MEQHGFKVVSAASYAIGDDEERIELRHDVVNGTYTVVFMAEGLETVLGCAHDRKFATILFETADREVGDKYYRKG